MAHKERNSTTQEALTRSTERLLIRPLRPDDFEIWRDAFRTFDPPKNEWDAGGMDESDISRREFDQLLREQTRQRIKSQSLPSVVEVNAVAAQTLSPHADGFGELDAVFIFWCNAGLQAVKM